MASGRRLIQPGMAQPKTIKIVERFMLVSMLMRYTWFLNRINEEGKSKQHEKERPHRVHVFEGDTPMLSFASGWEEFDRRKIGTNEPSAGTPYCRVICTRDF